MGYFHCRNGHCGDCDGFIGPLDTYVCGCTCHERDERGGLVPPDSDREQGR